MIKLIINNKEVSIDNKMSLEELALKHGYNAYCAKVNNRIRDLLYVVDKDCKIEFLDLTHVESMNVVNVEKGIGALFVTLEIRTVDVQWKDGKKSLVKVAAPIYDKMLAGMYR